LSDNWLDYTDKLDRLHRRLGDTPQLPLDYGNDEGKGL
jgi:hypothetical protein